MGTFVTIVVVLSVFACVFAADSLDSYNLDPDSVTVSGFSSGAAFSTQIHVALSSEIHASSTLAGSPYGCNVNSDEVPCFEKQRNVSLLIDVAESYSEAGEIDNVENLAGEKVYVWYHTFDCSGSGSTSANATIAFHRHFGSEVIPACSSPNGHGYPTLDYGNPCTYTGFPYINDCDYNMALSNLNAIVDGLIEPDDDQSLDGQLLEFNQTEFVPDGGPDSFDRDGGFVYVPSECVRGEIQCKLHVFFHGCGTGREFADREIVENVGLLEVAERNNLVMLFPQIHTRDGEEQSDCWDIFGYDGDDFATKNGVQIRTVQSMIHRALGLEPKSKKTV